MQSYAVFTSANGRVSMTPRMPEAPPPVRKYTVFVSSTKEDLSHEREEVARAILKAGHIPCGMEQFAASNDRGWGVITETIDLCDYYVIIAAGRYGTVDEETGLSWTEKELNYSQSKGIPTLAFVRDKKHVAEEYLDKSPKLRKKRDALIQRLRDHHLAPMWREASDLCAEVVQSLHNEIERDMRAGRGRAGWFRGDHLPVVPREDGWDRCGNLFWLGYDLLGVAYEINGGRSPNWKGPLTHAANVPIPSIWVDEIKAVRALYDGNPFDPATRLATAGRIIEIAKNVGRLIQSHQPDFPQRDPGPGPHVDD